MAQSMRGGRSGAAAGVVDAPLGARQLSVDTKTPLKGAGDDDEDAPKRVKSLVRCLFLLSQAGNHPPRLPSRQALCAPAHG
jgi:hypothetical protein